MNQKETFNRTVKNHHLDLLVGFECRDDLVDLRKHLRAEDVERRAVKRDSPILGRALGQMDLSILCCRELRIFYAGCLLFRCFYSARSSLCFDEAVPHKETLVTDRRGAPRYPPRPFRL